MSKTAVEKKVSQKISQFAFNKLHVGEDNAQLEWSVRSLESALSHRNLVSWIYPSDGQERGWSQKRGTFNKDNDYKKYLL